METRRDPTTDPRDPDEFRDVMRAAMQQLDAAPAVLAHLGSSDLTEAAHDVLAVLQLAESAAVTLAAEAARRGVVAESTAADLPQWLARLSTGEPAMTLLPADHTRRSGPLVSTDTAPEPDPASTVLATPRPQVPGLEPSHTHRIARVAIASSRRENAPVAAAVAAGDASVTCADAALRHAEKVMPLLPSATRTVVLGYYLALPSEAGVRAVRALTRRIIATYATEESLDAADI